MEKLSFLYGEISPQTLVTQKNFLCYWRDKYVAYSAKVGQLVFSEIQEQLDNSGNKFPFAKIFCDVFFSSKEPKQISVSSHKFNMFFKGSIQNDMGIQEGYFTYFA